MAKQRTQMLSNIGNIDSGSSESINSQVFKSKYNRLTLDKFSEWYNYENQITLGFPFLRKYENIITADLIRVELESRFHYKPEYLSYELYGTTDLWYVIMFINKLMTPTQFNMDTVLVPRGNLVDTINTLSLEEDDKLTSKYNPHIIKKNFLKKLNEPSTDVIKKIQYDDVPWMVLPNVSSKLDNLLNGTSMYQTEFSSNRGWLRDELGQQIPAIKLDPKGLTSIPSVFYKEGYNRTLRGRIKLAGGVDYSLNTYMNGTASLKIADEVTGERLIDIDHQYLYPEAMLINDMRAANTSNNVTSSSATIKYDEGVQGKYINHLETTNLVLNASNKKNDAYTIETIAFKANDSRPIMNASRLKDFDNAFFNLEYSNDLSDSKIIGFSYVVSINYTDGSKTFKEVSNEIAFYNTNGEISRLKGSILVNRSKTIKDIIVTTKVKVKPGVTSIALTNTFYSIEISGVNDEEIVNSFRVDKGAWYSMEINYNYSLVDRVMNTKIYKDMSFAGIYFDPTITRLQGTGKIDHLRNADMQDDGDTTNATPIDITHPYDIGDINKYTMAFTNNLKLPDKYIIDFSIMHRTKSQGGGVGFILDYDRTDESGYMLWISSTGQGNTSLPTFSRDPITNQIIMPSGFYEMDDMYGESKFIFEGDNSLSLKVSNYYSIPTEGVTLRMIKRNNRIKIYRMNNSTHVFDLENAILDIEDLDNFHTNGELGFIAAYAEMRVSILDYSTWDTISINDEEW